MVFRRQYGTRRPVRRTANGMSQLGGGRRMRRRGGFRWQIMLLFALGAGGYYLINQKTVPLTGRKQLRTMKPAQEIALGLQSYEQILSDSQVLADNQPVVKDIRRIGERLARTADQMLIEETGEPSGFDWAVNVIDSDQANAFALPGGYSAVYTGLIRPSRRRTYGAAKYAADCRRGCLAGRRRHGLRRATSGHGCFWRYKPIWIRTALFAQT